MSTPPYEGPSTGPKPGEIPEKDPNDEGSPVKSITPERYGDELDDLEAEIVLPFPVDFEDEEAENLLREILGDAYDQERPDSRSDLDSASTSGVEELSDEEKFQEDSQKLIRKDAETNILEEGKIKNEKIFNDATKKKVNKNKCKKSEKMDYEEVNVKKEKEDTKDLKKEYFDSLEEQRFYEEKDDYDDGDDEEKQSFQENEHGDDDELEHEEKMNDCEEDKDDKKCEDEENDDEEAENRRNILQRILRRRMPGEDALDYLINNEILPIEEKEEEEEESSTDKEDLKNRNIRRKNRVKKQKRHADKNIITTKNISKMSKLGKCLPVSQQRMTDEFKLILEKKTKKEKEMDKSSESEEENNEEFDEMKEGTVDKKIDKNNYCIEKEDDDCLINDGASTSETSENEGEQKEEEEIDLHEKTKRQIKKSPEMLLSAHLIRQKKIASVSSSKRANSLALKNLEVALDQLEEYRIPWCDITKIKTHRPVEGDSSCSSRGPSPDVKQELEEEQTHETSLKAENPKNRRKKVAKRKIKNGSSAINSTTSDDDTPTTSLTATGKANILLNGNRIETNEVNEKNEDLELEKEKNKALRRSRKLFEHEKHLHSSTNNMRKDGKKFEKQMIKELDEIIHKMEGWNEHWKVEGDLMLEEVSTAQKFGRIRHTLPIDSCKQEWVSVVEHIGKEEEEVDERDQMPFVDYDENDVISDVDEEDFTEEIPGTTPFVKNIMRNMGYRYIRKKLKDEHPPEPKKEDYNEWQFREFQDEYERRKADDMFFFTHRYTEDEELEDELVSAAMLQQPCTSNGVTTRYRSGTPLSRVGGSPANNVIIPASREFYSSPQPTLTRNRSGVATSLTNGGTPGRSTPSTVKTKKHEKDDEEEKITLEEEEADEIPASTDIENLNITSSRVQRKQRKVASTTTPSVPEKKIKRNIEKSGKDKDTKPEEGASNSVAHSTKKKSAKVKKSKDNDEPTYCVCSRISFGEMIGCDNDKCEIEWFHFECVSLSTKPKGKWYCPNCRHPEIGPKQMKQFGQSSTAVSNNRTTRQTEKA